jgi:hypothetical protein
MGMQVSARVLAVWISCMAWFLSLSYKSEAAEGMTLLSGRDPFPPAGEERSVILAFPGIGGTPDRSLYVEFATTGDNIAHNGNVRSWVQQTNLQPSQMAKQKRSVEWRGFQRSSGGGISAQAFFLLEIPAQADQPSMREEFDLSVELKPSAKPLPDLRFTRSRPPWRRVDFPMAGNPLRGRVTGTWKRSEDGNEPHTEQVDREAFGAEQPRSKPGGPWTVGGEVPIKVTQRKGAIRIDASLPVSPTDAGEGGWAKILWPERRDLSAYNALEIDYSLEGDDWVAWDVALEESPGLWYVAPKALPASNKRRKLIVPFSGMQQSGFDMDHWFTPVSTGGLRFAVSSGDGLGATTLRVYHVRALNSTEPGLDGKAWAAGSGDSEVTVDFARIRSVNGTAQIPEGLFGVHAVGAPKEQENGWKLADSGIRSLRTLNQTSFQPYKKGPRRDEILALASAIGGTTDQWLMESWSPPLLAPPPWMEDPEGLVVRVREFVKSIALHARSETNPGSSLRRMEFLNEPFMWARHVNIPGSPLWDPLQHGYMPGPLCAEKYVEMFKAAAEGVKAAGGGLELGGPSAASFAADDWRHLEQFVLPVVEAAGEDMRFITEHHYQGRGQQYAAEYDVLQAALCASAGRRVPVWNTECNDLVDQPGPGESPLNYAPTGSSRRRAVYQLAEILEHLRHGPDYTLGRSVHALWDGRFRKKGEEAAFALLAKLRGRQVWSEVNGGLVQVIASRDGNAGYLAVYNDGPAPAHVRVDTLGRRPGKASRMRYEPRRDVFLEGFVPDRLEDGCISLELAPLEAAGIEFPNLLAAEIVHEERVFYARDDRRGALWRIPGGGRLQLTCSADSSPRFARVVAERVQPGEAILVLGNVRIPLPRTDTGPRMVHVIPIPEGADCTRPELIVEKGNGGIRLCSLSFVTVQTGAIPSGGK